MVYSLFSLGISRSYEKVNGKVYFTLFTLQNIPLNLTTDLLKYPQYQSQILQFSATRSLPSKLTNGDLSLATSLVYSFSSCEATSSIAPYFV